MRGERFTGDERGSATVVGAGAIVVVLAVLAVGVQLGGAVITRHRAEAAADLAALAAAGHAVAGLEPACRMAGRVTGRMAVTLVSCELQGWQVIVRVRASPPALIEHFGVANAAARAGPIQSPRPTPRGYPRRAVGGGR